MNNEAGRWSLEFVMARMNEASGAEVIRFPAGSSREAGTVKALITRAATRMGEYWVSWDEDQSVCARRLVSAKETGAAASSPEFDAMTRVARGAVTTALTILAVPLSIIAPITNFITALLYLPIIGLVAVLALTLVWLLVFMMPLLATSWLWTHAPWLRPLLLPIGVPLAALGYAFNLLIYVPPRDRDSAAYKMGLCMFWPLSLPLLRGEFEPSEVAPSLMTAHAIGAVPGLIISIPLGLLSFLLALAFALAIPAGIGFGIYAIGQSIYSAVSADRQSATVQPVPTDAGQQVARPQVLTTPGPLSRTPTTPQEQDLEAKLREIALHAEDLRPGFVLDYDQPEVAQGVVMYVAHYTNHELTDQQLLQGVDMASVDVWVAMFDDEAAAVEFLATLAQVTEEQMIQYTQEQRHWPAGQLGFEQVGVKAQRIQFPKVADQTVTWQVSETVRFTDTGDEITYVDATITFRRGRVVAGVDAGATQGPPPLAELQELAFKQDIRILQAPP